MQSLKLLSLLVVMWVGPQTAKPTVTVKPAVTITVRAMSEVSGETFTLGQIAEITGADKAFADQLAAVPLGTSPLAGLSRPLTPADILTRLRAQRIDPQKVNLVT